VQETLFQFGPFELNTAERILRRNGIRIAVPPTAMRTLLVLLAAEGRVVSKAELLETVWANRFVDEANLPQAISLLRKQFAADFPAESPIETVARVGYLFRAQVIATPFVRSSAENPVEETHVPQTEGLADEVVVPSAPGPEIQNRQPEAAQTIHATRRFRLRPWLLTIPLVLLALALGFRYVRHQRSTEVPAMDWIRFSSNTSENRVTAAAISPEGRLIAYADADGVVLRGEHDIAVRSIPTPGVRQVERLAWSPDGAYILLSGLAASGVQSLWMLSAAGGPPVLVTEHATLGTLSPDGSTIAFVTETHTEVWIEDRAGHNARRVFAGSANDTFPVLLWSSDGKRLLIERHTVFPSEDHLHTLRTEDEIEGFHPAYLAVDVVSGRITATEDNIRIGSACLLATGYMLFSRSEETEYGKSSSFWKASIDPRNGAFTSAPEKIRDFDSHVLTLTAATKIDRVAAVFSRGRPGIYVGTLDLEKGAVEDAKLMTVGHGGPHGWTPDGSAVLFESNNLDVHRYHIYKQDLTRREPENLVPDMGGESLPRLAPLAHAILFQTRAEDGTLSIWRLGLAGGRPVLVTQGRSLEYRCPLSGPVCVLGAPLNTQRFAFWMLDPMHGKGRQVFAMPTDWNAYGDWDVSPDGSRLATVSPLSPEPEIRVAELTTGKTQEILIPIASPLRAINWMPEGNGWIVATSNALGNELIYVDAQGRPKPLRTTTDSTWGVPSPDGSKLAFADQDVDSNVWLLSFVR
jgi:DNA-binding winged helix-turn-helix (wHTH) protein/Tol biopolymer transport system component